MRIRDLTPDHIGHTVTISRPGPRGCNTGRLDDYDLTRTNGPALIINGHLLFTDLHTPITIHHTEEIGGL